MFPPITPPEEHPDTKPIGAQPHQLPEQAWRTAAAIQGSAARGRAAERAERDAWI